MSDREGWTIRALLRPHRRMIALILFLQILGVVAQAVSIILLKPMLNKGIYQDDFTKLIIFGGMLITCTLIASTVLFVTTYLSSRVATAAAEELRGRVVEVAVRSNDINALGTAPSDALVCMTNDVASVQRFVFETLRTYIAMPMLLGILMVYTFITNTVIGIILLSTMAFVSITSYIITKRLQPLYRQQVDAMGYVNSSLREKIPGARTIRAYNGYEYETSKFGEYSAKYGGINKKVMFSSYYISGLVTACMWIFIVFIFVASALEEGFELIATDIIIFMQVATYIIATLALIPYICVGVPRMRECFRHLRNLVTNAQAKERTYESEEAPKEYSISISARDVCKEDRLGRQVLNNVTMDVEKGRTVSIVGPVGNGSSELIHMALGFTQSYSGTLTVCGIDVSTSDPAILRSRISYASNSMNIFRGTLRYNIDPKGMHTDDEIMAMCDRVGVGKFIREMPEGLDVKLYDNVSRTSGGQRQLIFIVRSLLKDSELYIFDDCLFSLDKDTKQKVISTISEVCAGKTVVYVMHDTSTCTVSDTVILMYRGKVIEQGTHSELLESSELYDNLYRTGQGRNGSWA